MKKALNTILIVIVNLLAFVACSPEKAVSDELVSATLVSTDRATRALGTEVDFDITNVKAWKYTAKKADNGLKTGETDTPIQLLDSTTGQEVVKGTKTQALSQGSWNFTLYGYSDENFENLICKGTADNANVTSKNSKVTVSVQPIQTEGGKGKVVVSEDITIIDSNGTSYSTGNGGYTMTYSVYKGNTTSSSKKITDLDSVDVGICKVVVNFTGKTEDGKTYTAATASKLINVYDNLTTYVTGTIEESLYSTELTGESGVVSASSTKTVSSDTSTGYNKAQFDMEVASAPTGAGDNTKVSFPAGALNLGTDSNYSLTLSVSSSSIETAADNAKDAGYTVASGSGVVAALDFSLTRSSDSMTFDTFACDDPIVVTTYISKGWDPSDISVAYVGTSEGKDPEFVSYNKETGELVFNVYHFSEYVVVLPYTPVYDYTSFAAALKNSSGEIRLISDITLDKTLVPFDTKTHNINLNGHNITSSTLPFQIQKGTVEFSGKGTIETTGSDKDVIWVYPNTNGIPVPAKGSTVVTIGEDVTLKGGQYGIVVIYTKASYGANGAVINMKGTIEDSICGLYIHGNIKLTNDYAPTISLEGATINTTTAGIYGAGYGVWNLKDTTITTKTPFSLKSGSFTIESGTYTATGASFDPTTSEDSLTAPSKNTSTENLTDTGNGGVLTGSVLSLTSNDEYTKKLDVIVKGGTFTSQNGYAVYEGIPYKSGSTTDKVAAASYVTLDIQSGTFTGNATKAAVSLTAMTDKSVIKGGTFSSDPTSYIPTTGYTVAKDDATGTWTVSKTPAE